MNEKRLTVEEKLNRCIKENFEAQVQLSFWKLACTDWRKKYEELEKENDRLKTILQNRSEYEHKRRNEVLRR